MTKQLKTKPRVLPPSQECRLTVWADAEVVRKLREVADEEGYRVHRFATRLLRDALDRHCREKQVSSTVS